MDPTLLSTLLSVLDLYGFPIFILILGGFLLWRGVLRLGTDVDLLIKKLQEQVDYAEERRKEERQARIEAEERLESNNAALREATSAFKDSNEMMQDLVGRLDTGRSNARR